MSFFWVGDVGDDLWYTRGRLSSVERRKPRVKRLICGEINGVKKWWVFLSVIQWGAFGGNVANGRNPPFSCHGSVELKEAYNRQF